MNFGKFVLTLGAVANGLALWFALENLQPGRLKTSCLLFCGDLNCGNKSQLLSQPRGCLMQMSTVGPFLIRLTGGQLLTELCAALITTTAAVPIIVMDTVHAHRHRLSTE